MVSFSILSRVGAFRGLEVLSRDACGRVDAIAAARSREGRCETNLDVVVDLLDGLGLLDLSTGHPGVFSQLAKIFQSKT